MYIYVYYAVGNAKEFPTSMPQKSVSFNDDTTGKQTIINWCFLTDTLLQITLKK